MKQINYYLNKTFCIIFEKAFYDFLIDDKFLVSQFAFGKLTLVNLLLFNKSTFKITSI